MKKIYTFLVTLAISVAAFSASAVALPTEAIFSSNQGTLVNDDEEEGLKHLDLTTTEATVEVQFNEPVLKDENATLMVVCVPGVANFTADVVPVEDPTLSENGLRMEIKLTPELWGNPYMGNYHTTIMITWLDAEGDYFYNEMDEPVFFEMLCVAPNTNPAEFVYAYPNGSWEEDETFASAYANGEITFAFTNPVEFLNESVVANIKYVLAEDSFDEIVSYSEIKKGWNRLDGYYNVSFRFANDELTSSELTGIIISLVGTVYSDKGTNTIDVIVPQISLMNSLQKYKAPKSQSAFGEGLMKTDTVTVYRLNGEIVAEELPESALKDLPRGLYIVNGKKVII